MTPHIRNARPLPRPFHSCVLAAVFLATALPGCGRDRIAPADDATLWDLGEPRSYVVPPTPFATVEDAGTGATFRFPSGGGELTVTPIVSGPRTDATQNAFEIDYAGAGAVEILVTHDPEDYDFVLGYVPYEHMMLADDEEEEAGWLPFPSSPDSSGTLVFQLIPSPTMKGVDPMRWSGASKFKRLRVLKNSTRAVLMKTFEQNIRDALLQLIEAVPAARRSQVMTDIDGPLNATLFVDVNTGAWFPSKPKYVPFWDFAIFTPRCAIVLNDLSPESVAHEVGHYFHHVLVGNTKYADFALNYRSGHSIGTAGAKHNLIEEPAYFAEYFLKGAINTSSPEQGLFVVNGAGGEGGTIRPWTRDFTDLEGFATAVLASLTRQRTEIRDFDNRRVLVPVVEGETLARFQAAYEIIAQGTDDILELRDKVEAHLTANGAQQAKLPAMLEPLGWSYHARCRFVDDQGAALEGCTARSVSKVAAREYLLPTGENGSGAGAYRIQRVFPGQNFLRVYSQGDSTDVAINVPWTGSTTEEVDLHDIVVGGLDLVELLHQRAGIDISAYGYMERTGGEEIYTTFGVRNTDPGWPSPSPLQWSGTHFSFSRSWTYPTGEGTSTMSDSLSGEVSPDGRTILSITMRHEKLAMSDIMGMLYHGVNQATVVNIPVTSHPGGLDDDSEVRYYLQPDQVKPRVASIYLLDHWGGFDRIESTTLLRDDGSGWTFLFVIPPP